jgi:cell division protein FtsL
MGGLAAAALLVFARTEITELRYRLTDLVEREAELRADVEKLRIEAAALSAPERIEPRALALGLRYPKAGQVLALESLDGESLDVAAGPPGAHAPGPRRPAP